MEIDVEKLEKIVGEKNVTDNIADLYVYGSDSSVHEANPWVVARLMNANTMETIGLRRDVH